MGQILFGNRLILAKYPNAADSQEPAMFVVVQTLKLRGNNSMLLLYVVIISEPNDRATISRRPPDP